MKVFARSSVQASALLGIEHGFYVIELGTAKENKAAKKVAMLSKNEYNK